MNASDSILLMVCLFLASALDRSLSILRLIFSSLSTSRLFLLSSEGLVVPLLSACFPLERLLVVGLPFLVGVLDPSSLS